MENAINHWAEDFSWVEGTVRMVELEGGFRELEFGDESDPFGGQFVLGNPPQLDGIAAGTRVKLFGTVQEDGFNVFMAGTMYEVERVELLS